MDTLSEKIKFIKNLRDESAAKVPAAFSLGIDRPRNSPRPVVNTDQLKKKLKNLINGRFI